LRVRFTLKARSQLAGIEAYLRTRSPHGLRTVSGAIARSLANIGSAPQAGRPTTLRGNRKWRVASLPYVIIYSIDDERDEIAILGVFHTAQNRDDAMK
jgi:plasmid stabilization system protein ParE